MKMKIKAHKVYNSEHERNMNDKNRIGKRKAQIENKDV